MNTINWTDKKPLHLTEQQIRETIAASDHSDAIKATLLDRALAGDAATRFVVYTYWKRQRVS